MDCKEFEMLSMIYFDGDANEAQIDELFMHIDSCSSCSESFQTMQSMIEMLEIPDEFDIDEDFTSNVMAKVNEFEESRKKAGELIEKYVLPVSICFIAAGTIFWMYLFNNINFGLVILKLLSVAKYLIYAFVSASKDLNILNYLQYINFQVQVLLPISLVIIGIIIYADGHKKEENEDIQDGDSI